MSSGFDINGPLLGRYIAGDCSEEERAAVEAWLAEDPSHRRRLEELRWAWETSRRPIPKQDAAAAWQRMRARLETERTKQEDTSRRRRRAERRAAVARRRRPVAAALRVGSLTALVVLATLFAVRMEWISVSLPETVPPPAEKVFATAKGERATVLLTDGTHVRLNVDSRLTVSASFGTEERVVTLVGEAFFDVSPDAERPFRVHTGAATVGVVGTSFNVRAREAAASEVAVSEGRVTVRSEQAVQRDTVLLQPRDVARVESRSGTFVRYGVDLDPYLAWTSGRLVFRDASFDEVVRELVRWYDLDIDVRVPVADVPPFNGEFGDEPLSEILDIVASTLHLRYEREQRHVTFFAGHEPTAP